MYIKTWQARQKAKLTLRQLSSITSISKNSLNRIENNQKYPTLEELELIAIATNTKINELFESKYK